MVSDLDDYRIAFSLLFSAWSVRHARNSSLQFPSVKQYHISGPRMWTFFGWASQSLYGSSPVFQKPLKSCSSSRLCGRVAWFPSWDQTGFFLSVTGLCCWLLLPMVILCWPLHFVVSFFNPKIIFTNLGHFEVQYSMQTDNGTQSYSFWEIGHAFHKT